MMPSITLFTPTYNRAHTLPRLYQSICRQTLRNFEWLIVDDGSTDGTQALVEQWQSADNDFPIRYIWQPNQHKKVAFNRGVREARGKWFVPIDSDDELLPDALEQFMRMWQSIPEAEVDRYCAVVGLCVDAHGAVVGDRFPSEPLDATAIEQWFDHRIRGEKLGCLRTDVLRSYLFPEDIPNYVPESVVWFPMAQRYTQRCFNVPVRIYHRDVESVTQPVNALRAKYQNAEGAVLSYAEVLNCVTWARCLKSPLRVAFLAVQYGRWALYLPKAKRRHKPARIGARVLAGVMRPLGWVLYGLDHLRLTSRVRDGLARFRARFH
ncbi:glycosyltransferase family 2 protein [Thermosynechococcus sp. PP42]|uniref:glycosyltransferase family 2 protein n=1 Tax=Thermosynechococcus sp. PP42 TaxID=3074083 RepID=UPI0028644A4F|nr:glycosyltransferase family 2 protein [Thermosynechococcus sp. PP42]MDR5638518.1 glycosyltransferase family 2 protein [Thermosynechococcus sp. PP42]